MADETRRRGVNVVEFTPIGEPVNIGPPEATEARMLLRCTPDQWRVIIHSAKVKVLVKGRRWGGTCCMAVYLAKTAQEYPGSTSWYTAPSYSRALGMMRMMRKSPGLMSLIKRAYVQFPPRLELKNGSTIDFRSLERCDNLRGEGLKLLCMDEAAYCSSESYYETLAPMLIDSDGTAILGGTYNGRNWFYELAEKGKADCEKIRTWTFPTATGCRFQGDAGKKRYEYFSSMLPPAVRQQELECVPLASADSVFRFVDRILDGVAESPQTGSHYVMGLDLGRAVDNTALVVLDAGTGHAVFAERYPLGLEHSVMAAKAARVAERYNRAQVIVDVTGGASGGHAESYVRFYRQAMPDLRAFVWSRENKSNLINALALEIEQRRVHVPAEFVELIAQIKLYRYKMHEGGFVTYSAPTGEHDDYVSAFAMAVWVKIRGWAAAAHAEPVEKFMY